ncbi:MAG: protein phosphatase 2C domain-containing protein [Actinomycetia bacterium]|nr:protein phosphatase 2C domain-containing protein [Actinomycetes bacterium]
MLKAAVLTRQGLGRTVNQDRVVVNQTVVDPQPAKTSVFSAELPSLVAVLDGLGGHPAGDVAASLAAEMIASASSEVRSEPDVIALVEEANRFLYQTMATYPILQYMGTTIAGVLVTLEAVTVFHVGDSRVYFHAGGDLVQATVDDGRDGYVTQTLGGHDSFEPIRVHASTEPRANRRILAATDGLFDHTDRETLSPAMNGLLEEVPDQLSQVAIESANPDDFSVAVIEPSTAAQAGDPAPGTEGPS